MPDKNTVSSARKPFGLEFYLTQQTPIIHFQPDEEGACLRASEVKPKLDRFLWERLGVEYGKVTELTSEQRDWLIGYNESDFKEGSQEEDLCAFDYKMRFEPQGEPEEQIYSKKRELYVHPLFFGNQGNENKQHPKKQHPKKQIFYEDELKMKIVCFNKELLKHIEENIKAFFLLNNFGTRQSKGFGSFTVKCQKPDNFECFTKATSDNNEEPLFVKFQNYYSSHLAGKFDEHGVQITPSDNLVAATKKMDIAKTIYNMLKGGVNYSKFAKLAHYKGFIFNWGHLLGIDNEKAEIKHNEKVLNIKKGYTYDPEKDNENVRSNSRFLRAMLGLPATYEYKDTDREGNIVIEHVKGDHSPFNDNEKEGQIDRFPSPITIKIFDDYIVFLSSEIPDEFCSQTFKFKKKKEKNKQDEVEAGAIHLKTPEVGKVNISKLLSDFAKELNTEYSYHLIKNTLGDSQKGHRDFSNLAKQYCINGSTYTLLHRVGD